MLQIFRSFRCVNVCVVLRDKTRRLTFRDCGDMCLSPPLSYCVSDVRVQVTQVFLFRCANDDTDYVCNDQKIDYNDQE